MGGIHPRVSQFVVKWIPNTAEIFCPVEVSAIFSAQFGSLD